MSTWASIVNPGPTSTMPAILEGQPHSSVRDYILQLDYKEDLEDYVDSIKNFWNESETKLVQFILNNDQNYYAWVSKEVNIKNMYEVNIEDVDVDEVL